MIGLTIVKAGKKYNDQGQEIKPLKIKKAKATHPAKPGGEVVAPRPMLVQSPWELIGVDLHVLRTTCACGQVFDSPTALTARHAHRHDALTQISNAFGAHEGAIERWIADGRALTPVYHPQFVRACPHCAPLSSTEGASNQQQLALTPFASRSPIAAPPAVGGRSARAAAPRTGFQAYFEKWSAKYPVHQLPRRSHEN